MQRHNIIDQQISWLHEIMIFCKPTFIFNDYFAIDQVEKKKVATSNFHDLMSMVNLLNRLQH